MSEFEKTQPIEESAVPQSAPVADETLENSALAEKADVVENTEAVSVAAEEAASAPIAEGNDIQEPVEEEADAAPAHNYYLMTKDQLIDILAKIIQSGDADHHKDVNAIKQAFYAIRKNELEAECARFIEEGNDQSAFSSVPDPAEMQFKDLLAQFKDMRSKYLEAEEERRQDNLSFKLRILDQLQALVEDMDNINLHTPKFRQLEQEFKSITDIPAGAVNETWKRFTFLVDQFYDCRKVNKELRDLDFKKNLEAKTSLIEQAKSLVDDPDIINAFKKLQSLHDKWREIGPVAKELREDIWNEFKEASTVINKRHQEFFENRKEQEKENEEAKVKLCEEVEAIDLDSLKTFAAWDEATKAIIAVQGRWKEIGFASRKVNNNLFSRFRKTCDEFFSRKAEYFKRTKEEFASNLEKKIALCEKAEALKDSEDIKKATEQIVALQAEWRTIGSVTRKRSDEVWQRFMAACNHFFDAKKKAAADVRKEEQANMAAKREIIEALKSIPEDADRKEAISKVRELQAKWQSIGHVPYKMKDKLYEEYRSAADVLYDKFDIRETRSRMQDFEGQLESLEGDSSKLGRERDRLVRAYEARRNDLKTYENNLGFFNIKSKAGGSMLKEMERKMQRIKDDMAEIEKKIELLDSKIN